MEELLAGLLLDPAVAAATRTRSLRPDLAGVELGVSTTAEQQSVRERYAREPLLVVVRRPVLF